MNDPRDLRDVRLDHALDRTWAQVPTPDDARLIAELMAGDPARAKLLMTIPTVARGDVQVTPAETDAAWQTLSATLHADVARPITSARSAQPASTPARTRVTRSWMLTAAVLLVVVAGTATFRMIQSPSLNELRAPRGQRISATLPDGSTLTLAAGSRAHWSRDFGETERTIQLDGEAFFTVVHDQTRPFRVWARHSVIEDIGTRFAVRAWAELAAVEVMVEDGSVSVRDTAHTATAPATALRAGQRGRLPVHGPLVVSDLPAGALAWLDGTLQFDNTPLSEALPVIERWYNVTISVDPSLADRRLSARFEAQPIAHLLIPLGLALDATVRQSGPAITITPR